MSAPRPTRRTVAEGDVHAAERYLEALIAEDSLSTEEIKILRAKIEAVRQGEMTLAEFEERYVG